MNEEVDLKDICIGVDFGSNFIRAAAYYDGKFKIITNSKGWRATPTTLVLNRNSDIFYDDDYEFTTINEIAADCAYRFPDHRRLLSLKEECFQHQDRDNYPYTLIAKAMSNRLDYRIDSLTGAVWVMEPFYLSKRFLMRVYEDVNRMFNTCHRQYKTVISIPTVCSNHQKRIILTVALDSKFRMIGTLTATDACILNFIVQTETCKFTLNVFKRLRNILVFDMGATTLNLAIYDVNSEKPKPEEGITPSAHCSKEANSEEPEKNRRRRNDSGADAKPEEVIIRCDRTNKETEAKSKEVLIRRGVSSDLFLGGFDFDTVLVRHFSNLLLEEKRLTLEDLEKKSIKRRLRKECERFKISLTSCYDESLPFLFRILLKNRVFEKILTREDFEFLTEHLCHRAMNYVDELLKKCKLKPDDIDAVLLSGGSTSIPQIQRLLIIRFGADKVTACTVLVPRDESVLQGAALDSAMSSTHPLQARNNNSVKKS